MLSALFLAAGVATAPPVSTAAPVRPAPPVVAADANKKICRTESETGSRLGGYRVCMTQAEWDARAAQFRKDTDAMQQRAYTSATPSH